MIQDQMAGSHRHCPSRLDARPRPGALYCAALRCALQVLPTLGFRALLALSVSPALLILCTCWLVPESPMWLHAQGRWGAQPPDAPSGRKPTARNIKAPLRAHMCTMHARTASQL